MLTPSCRAVSSALNAFHNHTTWQIFLSSMTRSNTSKAVKLVSLCSPESLRRGCMDRCCPGGPCLCVCVRARASQDQDHQGTQCPLQSERSILFDFSSSSTHSAEPQAGPEPTTLKSRPDLSSRVLLNLLNRPSLL